MDFDRSSLPRSDFSIKLTDLIDSDFDCEADTVIISNFESFFSFAKAQNVNSELPQPDSASQSKSFNSIEKLGP